jgi:hypothetical protein
MLSYMVEHAVPDDSISMWRILHARSGFLNSLITSPGQEQLHGAFSEPPQLHTA